MLFPTAELSWGLVQVEPAPVMGINAKTHQAIKLSVIAGYGAKR
jgi:hypothetical protein